MKTENYDKAFAAGMALVVIILLSLMQATCTGCTVETTQSITIKKANHAQQKSKIRKGKPRRNAALTFSPGRGDRGEI